MASSRKKRGLIIGVVLLMLLFTATTALAMSNQFYSSPFINIEKDEYIKGPVFYGGEQVRMAGTIDGTAIIGGNRVQIDGIITGDLFVGGQEVVINGKVLGNLYAAGLEVRINGQVSGDVFGVGQRFNLTRDGIVERDMLAAGETVFVTGSLQRQLFAAGSNVVVAGDVGDDIRLAVEHLEVRDTANVAGNVVYSSPNEARIHQQSTIGGQIEWKPVTEQFTITGWGEPSTAFDIFVKIIISIVASLLVWFVLMTVNEDFLRGTTGHLRETPFKSMSVGLMVLIFTPIIAIIAMVTVVGFPLGSIALALYAISLYLSKIIAAAAIGYWLGKTFSWQERHRGAWFVLLGLLILTILTYIPIIKIFTYIGMVLGGLGSILIYLLNKGPTDDVKESDLAEY